VILWSRIGTPFVHTDGIEYQSGTHWELLDALNSNYPEVVIYRRSEEPHFKLSDPEYDEKVAQYRHVENLFESALFYDEKGKIQRGVNYYETTQDFRHAFMSDLEVVVLDILEKKSQNPSAIIQKEYAGQSDEELLKEAMISLNKKDYERAVTLFTYLKERGYESKFFSIEELRQKAQNFLEDDINKASIHRDYSTIAALAESDLTIEQARIAWKNFKQTYPNYLDDPSNLKMRLRELPPSQVRLSDIIDGNIENDFNFRQSWANSLKAQNVDWLQIPVGLTYDNAIRSLHFHPDADGKHGIITGTTGSGKSEFLDLLILSACLKYHPSIFNFFAVDMKSSSIFDELNRLPHYYTSEKFEIDLDQHPDQNLDQILEYFITEVESREKLLKNAGVKDIVSYHTSQLQKQHPMPHLLIIIDALFHDSMTYFNVRAPLMKLLQTKRYLGINLVLSDQRMSHHFSSDLRIFIKQRLALRVETIEDSELLLGISDAAYLPSSVPGRAYLKVNDKLDLIQLAFSRYEINYDNDFPNLIQQMNTHYQDTE